MRIKDEAYFRAAEAGVECIETDNPSLAGWVFAYDP
jgi:hypothetical protein